MRKECIIFLIVGVLLISGCSKTTPIVPIKEIFGGDPGEDYLKSAEAQKRNFVYRGECNEECEKVIATYQKAADFAKNPEVKAEALRQEAEFLLLLGRYEQAEPVINRLVDMAPNTDYKCTGLILKGQWLRMQKEYGESLEQFELAQAECEDRQDFVMDMICHNYDQMGMRSKAEALCPEKYS